jgi:hypothetical protein
MVFVSGSISVFGTNVCLFFRWPFPSWYFT